MDSKIKKIKKIINQCAMNMIMMQYLHLFLVFLMQIIISLLILLF